MAAFQGKMFGTMKSFCDICQASMNSEQQCIAHYNGKIHKQKIANQGGVPAMGLGISLPGRFPRPGIGSSQVRSLGHSPVTPLIHSPGAKRPAPGGGIATAMAAGGNQKRAKLGEDGEERKESPLAILRSFRPNLEFNVVSQTGSQHNPKFTLSIDIDGRRFEATGPKKKTAQELIANQVISEMWDVIQAELDRKAEERREIEEAEEKFNEGLKTGDPSDLNAEGVERKHCKSAIKVFLEVCPKQTFDKNVEEIISDGRVQYKVVANVNGEKYIGFGNTVVLAKANAAAEVLKKFFNLELAYTEDGHPMFVGEFSSLRDLRVQFVTTIAAKVAKPNPAINAKTLSKISGQYTNVAITLAGESPVMILNELYMAQINYETIEDSPEYPDMVLVRTRIDNKVFEGVGTIAKYARQNAALEALVFLKKTGVLNRIMAEKKAAKPGSTKRPRSAMAALQKWAASSNPPIEVVKEGELRQNNPLLRLNQLFPGSKYLPIDTKGVDSESPNRFMMAVEVEGKRFEGGGRTIKLARYTAAENALRALGMWTQEDEKAKKTFVMEAEVRFNSYQRSLALRGMTTAGARGLGSLRGPTGDIRQSFVNFKPASQPFGRGNLGLSTPQAGGSRRGRGAMLRGRGIPSLVTYPGFGMQDYASEELYDPSTQYGGAAGLVGGLVPRGVGARAGLRGLRGAASIRRGVGLTRGVRGAAAVAAANLLNIANYNASMYGYTGLEDYSYEYDDGSGYDTYGCEVGNYNEMYGGYDGSDSSLNFPSFQPAIAGASHSAARRPKRGGAFGAGRGSRGAIGITNMKQETKPLARGGRGARMGLGGHVGGGNFNSTAAPAGSAAGSYSSMMQTQYTDNSGYAAYGSVAVQANPATQQQDASAWTTDVTWEQLGEAASNAPGTQGAATYGAGGGYEYISTAAYTGGYTGAAQPVIGPAAAQYTMSW